jgi:phage terminase large subunit-like protein
VAEPWPPRWLTPVPEESLDASEGGVVASFADQFGVITKDSVAGLSGSPLILRDWQKSLMDYVFAGDDEDGYRHRVSLVGMPRKSGKSALGSLMALYSLVLGPKGGEVYSVAAEKEQARIVFADAKRTIEQSPELSAMTKLYRDAIEMTETGSVYRVLSAEAPSKEGLSPTLTIFDELHAQPNRALWDVMSLAMGARGNKSMLIAISTAGVKSGSDGRDSICYDLYQYGQRVARGEVEDSSFFMAWWEAAEEADHRLEETWKSANPGYGDLSDPADFESAVRRTPEAEFRTKRCNQWVSSQVSWLPTGSWDACEGDATITEEDDIVIGFDGSFNGDTTVLIAATIPREEGDPVRLNLIKAWEKDPTIHDDLWRVNVAEVEEAIINYCKTHPRVKEIACDPYRWTRSMEVLQDKGFPIVEYPSTSPRRMVPACAKFYDLVAEKRLVHDGDPLLARHMSNAVTKIDNLGVRIVKDNKLSQRRIDAAVASVIAVDRAVSAKLDIVPQFFV